jgi:pimeloyl-ACP methyl ester carboxylesterase
MPDITCDSGLIRNNDAEIYYEVHCSTAEQAPVLILLHGNGEDMHCFDGRFERLLPYYNVVCLDTRGQGRSTRGTRPLSYELFAEDLFTVVNKLQIGSFLLLGFSDGGITALEFALAHQERLEALIVVGANLDPEGLTRATRNRLELASRAAALGRLVKKGPNPKKELIDLMLTQPHIAPDSLTHIKVPALVICGQDDMVRAEHSELIASLLPNARLEVVQGASHFVMADAPERFDELVYDFLMEE